MQQTLPIDQIRSRAVAINLTLSRLARRARVQPSTAYRAAAGSHEARRSTERKLLEQLEREERRVLEHLLKLDGARRRARMAA